MLLLDYVISFTAISLLYASGGWASACIGAIWAMWNYADGKLNLTFGAKP